MDDDTKTFNTYSNQIKIKLSYSAKLFRFQTILYLASCFVLLLVPMTIAVWPFLLVTVIAYFKLFLNYKYKRFAFSAEQLILDSKDDWSIYCADGEIRQLDSVLPLFAHPLCLILKIKIDRKNFFLVFLDDNLQESLFKQLLIRIRFPMH